MLTIFLGLNGIASPGTATTTTIPVIVGGLNIDPSSTLLSQCANPAVTPSNITDGVIVPLGTFATAQTVIANQGAGDFDCFRTFDTASTASNLLGFYKAQLSVRGWNLFSQGASSGDPQLLFQKAGSDTFYWVIGVTVTRSGPTSHWTFRIYQNSSSI